MKNLYLFLLPLIFACGSNSNKEQVGAEAFSDLNKTELKQKMEDLNHDLREDVNNAQLYCERSYLFQAQGDLDLAINDVNRALTLDSKVGIFHLQLAKLLVEQGNYGQAEGSFLEANKLDPNLVESRLKLGEMYTYFNRLDESMTLINEVLRLDKYNADAYFLKGLVYERLKDTSLAVSSFQTAIEQNPEFFEAYFETGLLLASQKNPLAIGYYDNAIRLRVNDVQSYYNKGLLAQELGDYNLALKTYSDLLKINPNYADAHFNMGYINMYYLKLYKQGAIHFSDAIKVAPSYYQAYYNRGYCYELLGDIQRASIDYQNALNIQPDYTLAAKGMERVTL